MAVAAVELDPARILRELPEEDRAACLAEYQAARLAAEDPERYEDLREVLARWRLIAATKAQPGYADRAERARRGEGEWISMEEVMRRYTNPAAPR